MSIESFIKENVKEVCDKVYLAPEIPEKKLNAAIKSMVPTLDPDYVLAIIDTTVFGGAKDGALLTGKSFYFHPFAQSTIEVELINIESAECIEEKVEKNSEKVEIKQTVIIKYKDGETKDITNLLAGMNYEKMVDLLNNIVEQADSEDAFTMTSQLTPLSMMDEEIKKDYIKILCNFAYFDDEMIDPNEYAEIMSLIVRIEMSSSSRLIIRAYMLDGELHEKNHFILSRISESADEESYNEWEEF